MTNLTDTAVRAAKYRNKPEKLRDGNGLYLHLMAGGKYWRYDYRYQGKRRTLSLGVYPSVSLKQARIDLFSAKEKLDDGIDPSYEKQLRKHINDNDEFKQVALEFMDRQNWTEKHQITNLRRLEKDVFPKIGSRPIQSLKAPDFLYLLRAIESRGSLETAHRVKTLSSQIMRYGVVTGRINSDPCRDLKGALKMPTKRQYPAITDRHEFGRMLRAMDTYDQYSAIGFALSMAPYVAMRPGEIRGLTRDEIKLNKRIIEIHPDRMKRKRPHIIPLAEQVVLIIEEALAASYDDALVFPAIRKNGRPISDGTLNKALEYVGVERSRHVPHGFRSTFSTHAYESQLWTEDAIEFQLSHFDKNRVKAAYDRGARMDERTKMMQWWADEIDAMRQDAHLPTQ